MIVVIIILMSHLTQPEWIVSCVNGEELGRGAGEGEDVDGCSAHNNNLVTPQSKDGEKRRYGTYVMMVPVPTVLATRQCFRIHKC